jgi:hypothetical protein
MTPRDELELNVLERTGDPTIAEDVGACVQAMLEAQAASLAPIMGVPPEMLMADLWEMVDRS